MTNDRHKQGTMPDFTWAEAGGRMGLTWGSGGSACGRPATDTECRLIAEIEQLRSSLSNTRDWILCSERKPEDGQMVLGYWPRSSGAHFLPPSYASLIYHAADAPDGPEKWRDVFGNEEDEPSAWMAVEALGEPK